jgi:hypothetical protein
LPRSLDDLELELRKVPGVVGVGLEESAGVVRVDLVISAAAPSPLLVRAAEDAVRDVETDKVILSVSSAARCEAVGGRERRVQLVAVRRWDGPAGPGSEVQLRWEGRDGLGRDLAAGPGGAAAATLDALDKLGVDVPFQLTATVPSSPAPDGVTVLVKLASIAGLTGRMGLVKALTAEEAASRAVLCALNRFIADPRNAPRGGPGIASLAADGRQPAGRGEMRV